MDLHQQLIDLVVDDSEVIRFDCYDLIRKNGFQDGNILEYWLDAHDIPIDGYEFADTFDEISRSAIALIEVVKNLVIPHIENKLDIAIVGGLHNPIRTYSVDGEDVDWTESNDINPMRPEYVDVLVTDIIAVLLKNF